MSTFGLEEEFFLLDPKTLQPANIGSQVLNDLSTQAFGGGGRATAEFLESQVEFTTGIFTSLAEAEGDLRAFRIRLATLARSQNSIAAGTGTPFDTSTLPVLTDKARYRVIESELRGAVGDHQISGTHVHIGVPDRDAGVEALNRMRVWLPTLLALTGNSPFWRGSDTGFDSWRAVLLRRWPTNGCPPVFNDATDYGRRIRELVGVGATPDTAAIGWSARLSESHPTLEVRVADAQLDSGATALFVALTRGLVETALAEAEAGTAPLNVSPELLDAALWHAARDGIRGELLDPITRERQSARAVVQTMLRHIEAALAETGDGPRVADLLEGLWQRGSGADRQRRAYRHGGPSALGVLLNSSVTT
ncbi:glutamate--cysteine ligase [Cryobacterium sp. PH31-L1]|uniref:carboxylate-amine ligase n=1 Tax=Cryobacterium sp. PH31-L1 TaxID=3046199 RepID=UPI0024BA9450|nr:glutamate--cysteine ligase [Cryobacterium sp. PH31-L1]MDJ0379067.1 glutamate--cysteine ligase [Cryobacterium sp. PH31-L1]